MPRSAIRIAVMAAIVFSAAGLISSCGKEGSRFDLVIANGSVVDGSGSPGFSADIAVRNDTIVRIGRLSEDERRGASKVIDAQGLAVAPGFIDIHTHSEYALLVDGTAQSKIHQGVTTEILGEAESPGPFQGRLEPGNPYGLKVDWRRLGEYFDRLQQGGVSLNVASFVGATQVRACVLGDESRDPTAAELREMKLLVGEAMRDGAVGLSCALLVPPNSYLTKSQLIEMASAAKQYGGTFFLHIRTEGEGIREAVGEALEIAQKADIPVEILHLKIADRRLWGRMKEVCDLIDQARSRGIKATADQYPYIAGQNNLVALVPPWAMEGGKGKMLERLGQPEMRRRMEKDLNEGIPGWYNHFLAMSGWEGCLVASVATEANRKYQGKSIAEISKMTGKKPEDVVFDLLREEQGSVPAVYFLMSEDDVRYAMRIPWVSFGSDGAAVRPEGVLGAGRPHPRWYGTFPRILGKYVRDDHVLTLEEAIRKMTSLNAEKLGITNRGLLREGMRADITIFDPRSVRDRAAFGAPHQYPEGIEHVIVNGTPVLEHGRHLGTKPGKILRRIPFGPKGNPFCCTFVPQDRCFSLFGHNF